MKVLGWFVQSQVTVALERSLIVLGKLSLSTGMQVGRKECQVAVWHQVDEDKGTVGMG